MAEKQAEIRVAEGRRANRLSRVFYGWWMVGAGMGIHLWMSIAWVYGMQFFFTPLTQTFGWSRTAISGAFALQRIEGSILTPIEGFLVDRIGPRILVLIGGFIAGLGLISMSFVQTIWMFYASVLIVSMGMSACVGVPRTWAIVQWFRRRRGRAIGIGSTGAVISGPLVFIVVWLIDLFGWRFALIALGVATWAIVMPLALVYRDRPEKYGQLPDGDRPQEIQMETEIDATAQRKSIHIETDPEGLTVRQALRSPAFWTLILVFAAQTTGVNALIVHQTAYFESIGFDRSEAAGVLGLFTLLSVGGRLGGGWIMDYVDKRVVLAVLLGCQASAFLVLANITTYWQIVPFAILYGTAFGGMIPARAVMVSAFFGRRAFGAIQGLIQSGTIVGGVAAPLFMGKMFDLQGTYIYAIYVLAAISAMAIPLTLLVRAPKELQEPV